MATLTVQSVPRNSGDPSIAYTAAASSDTFPNTGKEAILIQNDDASAKTFTVAPGGSGYETVGDGSLLSLQTETAISVAAGERGVIGPLDRKFFGSSPVITPSATTSVSYAVVKLGD